MEPSASPLGATNSELWQLFSKTWIGSRFSWHPRIHSLHHLEISKAPQNFAKKHSTACEKLRFTSLSPIFWKVRTASFAWFGFWCNQNRVMIGIKKDLGRKIRAREKGPIPALIRVINSRQTSKTAERKMSLCCCVTRLASWTPATLFEIHIISAEEDLVLSFCRARGSGRCLLELFQKSHCQKRWNSF